MTADSINNFGSQIQVDQDSDGDSDTAIYILGDSLRSFRDLVVVSPDEGWSYLKSDDDYNYYQSGDGNLFYDLERMGVYELSSDASISISSQALRENLVNGEVGTISLSGFKQLSPDEDVATFSIGGEDAGKFEITDGNILKLKSGTKADFENQSSYSLPLQLEASLKNCYHGDRCRRK